MCKVQSNNRFTNACVSLEDYCNLKVMKDSDPWLGEMPFLCDL